MDYVADLADRLAQDTLKAQDALGEDRLYVEIARVIGASSTTLEEAFLTAIRVRLAERAGRAFLLDRVRRAKGAGAAGG
ncbi:hypothetical protein [Roseivivax sp. CAU 1761]